ncbi:MAG TPA: hypothetical protein VF826_17575 [Chloroflexia bacterium]
MPGILLWSGDEGARHGRDKPPGLIVAGEMQQEVAGYRHHYCRGIQ